MENKNHENCLHVLIIITGLILIAITRVLYVLYRTGKPLSTKSPKPMSTLIVLGSGGHTAEMINVLTVLQKDRFSPRYYIAAATDNMSLQKARVLEDSFIDSVLGIRWSYIFYVESIARVRRLSLSGLLLYKLRIADQFFVQWPKLQKKYPRAHHVGCLM